MESHFPRSVAEVKNTRRLSFLVKFLRTKVSSFSCDKITMVEEACVAFVKYVKHKDDYAESRIEHKTRTFCLSTM